MFDAEEVDEAIYAVLVEVFIGDFLAEFLKMMCESCPALQGCIGPLAGDALFFDEFFEVIEDGFFLRLYRNFFVS